MKQPIAPKANNSVESKKVKKLRWARPLLFGIVLASKEPSMNAFFDSHIVFPVAFGGCRI
jgi:hypothetical protein